MANRGMLPKFRPATIEGREAPARPVIRPVRPTAPPPPPAPPRRASAAPHGPAPAPAPYGAAIENNEWELPTSSFQDPPTMAAARQRVHEIARALPSQYDDTPRFEDETQGRLEDLITAPRGARRRGEPLDVPYESLPSLETARPYDEYEAQFAERDPRAFARAQQQGPDSFSAAPVARRYVDSGERVREPSEPPPAPKHARGIEEDSGSRERPRKNATPAPQYDAAAYEANYPGARHEESFPHRQASYEQESPRARRDESSRPRRGESYQPPVQREESHEIPVAPAIPHDMQVPAGFVMGVQPLRTGGSVAAPMPMPYAGPEAFPAPPQHGSYQPPPARTPMMGVPFRQPTPAMPMVTTSPRGGGQAPPQQMHIRPSGQPVHPVGHQLQPTEIEEAQQSSKVGRFAWFVFGAAFGIFFAFFATGFVPRLGKKEEIAFPPPVQLPAATQQAPVAAPPPPVQAPPSLVSAPVASAPVPPAVQQVPVAPPPVQPAVTHAPVVAQVAPPPVLTQAPVVAAPPPVAQAPALVMAPPPTFVAPAPAPQPVAAAPAPSPRAAAPAPPPAPRGQRGAAIARRNAPAPSSGPKAMLNSGSVDSDDSAPPAPSPRASAPKESKGGADVSGIGDLLNAGLAP